MIVRWRRSTVAWLVVVLACACAVVVPAVRTPVLRLAGRALVTSDPIEPADVIVVGSEAGGAGVLEAADLRHIGIAPRVAVFTDPPDADVDHEFIRRGVPYEDAAERSVSQFHSLGVEKVERIPRSELAPQDEYRVLADWCEQHQIRSVIVVTNSYHSRRLRRELQRATAGRRTKFTIRAARYTDFDPDRWWWTRGGVRTEVVELQRLLLDLARHPFS